MKRIMLAACLWLMAIITNAQVEVIKHFYVSPDTTSETIFEYAKNHKVKDINNTVIVLWHPYSQMEALEEDENLGDVPISFYLQMQDFTLKNGEEYDNGQALLYIPIAPRNYELTEQNVKAIQAKLRARFVLTDKDADILWKKDKFKVTAHEETELGQKNRYVTFHCLTYPKQYYMDF